MVVRDIVVVNCCNASEHDISICTMFLSNLCSLLCINRVCLAGTAAKGQGSGSWSQRAYHLLPLESYD